MSSPNALIEALQIEPDDKPAFVIVDGHVRFSAWGRKRYGPRFAAAEIDIDSIDSVDTLEDALAESWPFEATALADWVADQPLGDPLERSLLAATAQGEENKAAALQALLKARKKPNKASEE